VHAPQLLDLEPTTRSFLDDVLRGLTAEEKWLSCKYLYDARGSQLFDAIGETPEYYLTRTELAITRDSAEAIAAAVGPGVALVEYGSGSSRKTRILLDHLEEPAAYVPVDISREHLAAAARGIAARYPDLAVHPVCADFTRPFELPPEAGEAERVVAYFPGSTIGNFGPDEALALLVAIGEVVGSGGGLLVGVDLFKSADVLLPAYADAAGVTDAFNLNLLARINRELAADFDLAGFRHEVVFNRVETRMEMYLVSEREQLVTIGRDTPDETTIPFAAGERIHTEFSYKYTRPAFAAIAAEAGFAVEQVWTDAREWFSVQLLVNEGWA
jgi:dimethylhistidine N-methyltransferase